MMSKEKLIESFISGAESGEASNMKIDVIDGRRAIIGYGWAVYAADLGDGYALFGDGYATDNSDVGWAGYSGTTTQHLQEIKGALSGAMATTYRVADVELRAKPAAFSTDSRPALSEIDDLSAFVGEHEVEPREATGYYYRQ